MSSTPDADRRRPTTDVLAAYLWDLRAQAEAKLRCLTRLQQQLAEYDNVRSEIDRKEKHQHILRDLTDIVTISKALHEVAVRALDEANELS
jgi:hypothetical protein